MTRLQQAYRQEADADERVAVALGHRDIARAAMRDALRAERLRQSISVREMARRIGCSAAHWSDIERGHRWGTALVHEACRVLNSLPVVPDQEGAP